LNTVSVNFPEWLMYGLGMTLSFVALRMLWQQGSLRALGWAIGWVSLAAAGILSLLVGADFGRYRNLVPDVVIATVTIADPRTADQSTAPGHGSDRYRANIATRSGPAWDVDLNGSHWIFDIRTIHCSVPLCPVNLYRNHHFYAARAQSGDALPGYDTVVMGDPDSLFDIWSWITRLPRLRGLVQASEMATTSIPARAWAIYEIRIDSEGRLRVTDIGY
jgi:hypothetical protein